MRLLHFFLSVMGSFHKTARYDCLVLLKKRCFPLYKCQKF
ncbi:predicted coding region HP0314 [Helicobacter pylori 26695]|uniref:Uncharacterized protein n=1 Tax=Helicobacter pylori (strain ATCC 700392 / 26695) TaxID=85962 RepID=O25084_HELPY|nr:predicted coding region HP0314 [Helicobacter pylori 26695]